MDTKRTYLIRRSKEYDIKPGKTLKSVLAILNILPEIVLATRNGELILEDEIIREGDKIILVDVISGG